MRRPAFLLAAGLLFALLPLPQAAAACALGICVPGPCDGADVGFPCDASANACVMYVHSHDGTEPDWTLGALVAPDAERADAGAPRAEETRDAAGAFATDVAEDGAFNGTGNAGVVVAGTPLGTVAVTLEDVERQGPPLPGVEQRAKPHPCPEAYR